MNEMLDKLPRQFVRMPCYKKCDREVCCGLNCCPAEGKATKEHCGRDSCLRNVQVRIVKEDGAVGLFRGAGPTVVRAMALNMGMLASNDQVRTHMCSLPLLPFPMPSGVEGTSMQNWLLQGATSDWAKPTD